MAAESLTSDERWRSDLELARIAEAEGTPIYVYDAARIRDTIGEIRSAFGHHRHAIHYAMKANSTLGLMRLLRALGVGVDANSGGEIEVALRAGFEPAQIVFTGVGKTSAELERAVGLGVKVINAESAGELDRIGTIAARRGARAPVAVRINPDVDAESHPHISTGLERTKFGVALDEAATVCGRAAAHPGLRVVGLHVHVGSQMVTLDPIRRAAEALARLSSQLCDHGIELEHLDFGGGLGISYDRRPTPGVHEWIAVLCEVASATGLSTIVEPGRVVVGPAGALVARVVDVKRRGGSGRPIVVLDAGMSEFMRPMLYGARHRILPLEPTQATPCECEIVGPLCESGDAFGCYELPLPAVGDLLAVLDTGAYGAAMASNYNRRSRPAEVLVDEGAWQVVRHRQTADMMLAGEP